MGDIEDGFFGKIIGWFVSTFVCVMDFLMLLTGKNKEKK